MPRPDGRAAHHSAQLCRRCRARLGRVPGPRAPDGRAVPRQAGDHPPDDRVGDRRRAHGDRRSARHREVGDDRHVREADRRALLRVPAHALHRAERAVRPGRHLGVPRGPLHAPPREHAADRGDRLPRRDLQVELRDPELAAPRHQRAQVPERPRGRPGPADLALRRLERGAERREPRGDVRSLPRARAVGQPRQLSLPRADEEGRLARAPQDDRARRRSRRAARPASCGR